MGSPKLTTKQVREIRRRCIYDCERQAALAREFGVSESTISRLVRGLTPTYGMAEAR
jgi:transcriptional regulator with XRE-family HTH domain